MLRGEFETAKPESEVRRRPGSDAGKPGSSAYLRAGLVGRFAVSKSSLRRIALVALLAAAAGAGPLSARSTDDQVLDALHDRGGDLRSFTADVKQTQTDLVQGNDVTYRGTVVYQQRPGGDARLHLPLDTKQKGTGPIVKSKREYLLDKGWLTDRDYSIHNDTRRQLVRPGQAVDLFSLGKGSFPLPVGQDRAQVRKLFDVSRQPPDKDDPPHTVHLQLTPKPGTDLARQFKTIDVWVDTAQRMPVRIDTVDAKQAVEQTTDLTNLKVNPPVTDANFALPPTVGKWNTHDEPL